MKNNQTLCPICQTNVKVLKHSILCKCGIKLKPANPKVMKRLAG